MKVKSDDGPVILPRDEYEQLKKIEKFYTRVTKTSANNGIKKLLKHFDVKCWHDMPEYDEDGNWNDLEGWCDGCCPVITVLGNDLGERLCTKQKTWSK